MDAATSLTVSRRAIDTLKSVPLWLLAGSCLSLLVIWSWPSFYASLPASAQPWIPIALLVAGILATCRLVEAIASRIAERGHAMEARDRQKLIHLYRPLTALFHSFSPAISRVLASWRRDCGCGSSTHGTNSAPTAAAASPSRGLGACSSDPMDL
jgi:hypothetical protein